MTKITSGLDAALASVKVDVTVGRRAMAIEWALPVSIYIIGDGSNGCGCDRFPMLLTRTVRVLWEGKNVHS